MPRLKTSEDYLDVASSRKFKWLGPFPASVIEHTNWRCLNKHDWSASYHSIRKGSGCPYCAGLAPKTPDDYHTLAIKCNLKWIGPVVYNIRTKTWWECEKGHRWQARYNDIHQGHGCPKCAILSNAEKRKYKETDYFWLAKKRGFIWLGSCLPKNSHTKTKWKCQNGHQWYAPYNSIKQGRGCPHCSNRIPKTPLDYHELAKKRGYNWIGPKVRRTDVRTKWKCEEGHVWESRFNDIQQGHGCPFCAGFVTKQPDDYQALAQKRGFTWIGPKVSNVDSKTGWECEKGHYWDAIYSSIKKGTGCPICAKTNLIKKPEAYKSLASERGFIWLGPEVKSVGSKTWWECEKGHKWETTYTLIQRGSGCHYCGGTARRTADDYHSLAKKCDFKWLGTEAPTTQVKTKWACSKNHEWDAPYSDILQGHGCPYCTEKAHKTPDDYHKLAHNRGFNWLGPEAQNIMSKTGWECERGHKWEAIYNSIQQGRGCPVCIDMVHGARVSQVQRDLCDLLGGKLNYPFRKYNIDVALIIDNVKIAVEYDSWYWHGNQYESDKIRDRKLIEANWRVLRIKSNELLPERKELKSAIAKLISGSKIAEIILNDWGKGKVFRE